MNLTGAIDVGVLMLTARCDMHCAFCGADAKFADINIDDADSILQCMAHQGVKNLVLGGGEPLAWHADVFEIAGRARNYNFFVQVGTNANRFKPSFACDTRVDRWVLPLESDNPKAHDAQRPSTGSNWLNVYNAMEACRAAGREVTVSTVVSKETLGELSDLATFLGEWVNSGGRLHAWHLYRFQPEGRGGLENARRFSLPLPVYQKYCRRLREKNPQLHVLLRSNFYKSKQVAFFWQIGRSLVRRDRHGIQTVLCHLHHNTFRQSLFA